MADRIGTILHPCLFGGCTPIFDKLARVVRQAPKAGAELAGLCQALQSVGIDLICDAIRHFEQQAMPAHALQLYYLLMRCTSLVQAGRFGAALTA